MCVTRSGVISFPICTGIMPWCKRQKNFFIITVCMWMCMCMRMCRCMWVWVGISMNMNIGIRMFIFTFACASVCVLKVCNFFKIYLYSWKMDYLIIACNTIFFPSFCLLMWSHVESPYCWYFAPSFTLAYVYVRVCAWMHSYCRVKHVNIFRRVSKTYKNILVA